MIQKQGVVKICKATQHICGAFNAMTVTEGNVPWASFTLWGNSPDIQIFFAVLSTVVQNSAAYVTRAD